MAKNKINNSYTVKDCTPFSQDVKDDVLKKLSEYFEKEGIDLIALTNLETVLHHAENMNMIDSEDSKAIHAWQRKPSKWTK